MFYEHKQLYYVSVWAEFTGTCELNKLISIFTSLKNYYQLDLMFCAESTKIVVLGIATRRWRCRTSHRPKIMSDLDLTSHIDTEKIYNICFTNICTLFRDGCVEALISVGTTRTLSSERTRVPCGCATTNMRNIVAQRLRMFYCNEHIVKLFFFWVSLLECGSMLSRSKKCCDPRITFPAGAYEDYVTTYRNLSHTCHLPSIQAC